VRDFFCCKKTNPETGKVVDIGSDYFLNDSEYARLHTEQRVAMIKVNPAEFDQWVNVFIFDIYAMVAELQMDDPNKEPFIPGTAFNGLTDLANDIVTPFMVLMSNAGNSPMLKIYPDTGHFIHTDRQVEFAADAVDFVQSGSVSTNAPVTVDRLVNGATVSAWSATSTPAGASPTAGLNK
jgi:homoserine O-acetyltransferase/O-succinyltransferase